MDYERGLERLKQLAEGTDWYQDITPHETTLLDRLHDERLYGPAPQTHQELMRAVDQLNRLAFKCLGISFNDLCLGKQISLQTRPAQQSANVGSKGVTQQSGMPYLDTSPVDVGIVIALKEEFTELYKQIENQCVPIPNPETGGYSYLFERAGADGKYKYRCIVIFAGEMGPVKAGLMTQRLIYEWQPRTLVMLGIAAALSDDVQLGDVVVASQVDAYLENSKAIRATDHEGYVFVLSGEVYRSSVDLLNFTRHFEFVHRNVFQEWRDSCRKELLQLVPQEMREKLIASKVLSDTVQLTDGHIASGPTVGASQAFSNWLKTRDRKYLALDMEAAGLMAAVYEQADPKRTLVLRAISDYGDERKKDLDKVGNGVFRRYAMRNAIQLLWRFFDAGILPYTQLSNSPVVLEKELPKSGFGKPLTNVKMSKDNSPLTQISSAFASHQPLRSSAFISYNHKDRKYLDELHIHLAYYERMGLVNFWDDTMILPGAQRREEVKKALTSAKVFILLISADFLASDFIANDVLPLVLAAAEQEEAIILSVILRPCAFKDTKLAQFQPVNAPSEPLSRMTSAKREQVWLELAELVKDALKIQT